MLVALVCLAGGGLYVGFNTGHVPKTVELPNWHGRAWKVVKDPCPASNFFPQHYELNKRSISLLFVFKWLLFLQPTWRCFS
jgi:hypothetical protein